jgi:hypothetical protein
MSKQRARALAKLDEILKPKTLTQKQQEAVANWWWNAWGRMWSVIADDLNPVRHLEFNRSHEETEVWCDEWRLGGRHVVVQAIAFVTCLDCLKAMAEAGAAAAGVLGHFRANGGGYSARQL